jgi:outer membrane lipoprotein-sorting protein
MTISGKDYLFREMETSNEGTTMTMRLTHFRVGVPDDIFTFDPNQYPDAVIIERVE